MMSPVVATLPNHRAKASSALLWDASSSVAQASSTMTQLNPRSTASRAVVSTHTSVPTPATTSVRTSMLRRTRSISEALNALFAVLLITSSPGRGAISSSTR